MRRAVFLMGGPAAGKSTVRARDYVGVPFVDADVIKSEHPDYDPSNPSVIHEWSSQEATRRFYALIGSGYDVVFDGTGNTAEKYVSFILAAQACGYATEVCYVSTDLKTALARNTARVRRVPDDVVRDRYARIATSFEIVSRYADTVRVVRN